MRDLLSMDSTPLRLLDDPEVSFRSAVSWVFAFPTNIFFFQRGTVVEKLTEEAISNWSHMIHLLSVSKGRQLLLIFFRW